MTADLLTYYYDQLSNDQKRLYRALKHGLQRFEREIIIPGNFGETEIEQAVLALTRESPELFHVNMHEYSYVRGNDLTIKPVYILTPEETKEYRKYIDSLYHDLGLNNSMSDLQKTRIIHDYLCRTCTYNEEVNSEDNHCIIGPLIRKTAVCEGIAKTFHFLARRADLSAMVATGKSKKPKLNGSNSQSERHAWNIVMINDEPVHVDVTWDMCLTEGVGDTRYDYFALSDRTCFKDHSFLGLPSCLSDRYSYFKIKKIDFFSLPDLMKWISGQPEKIYFRAADSLVTQLFKDDLFGSLIRSVVKPDRAARISYSVNDGQNCFYAMIKYM